MFIEIVETKLTTDKSGTGQNGRPYHIRKQGAYAHGIGKYPIQIQIGLRDSQAVYSVGWYTILESSFYADRFGNLLLSQNLDLQQVSKPESK